MITENKYRQLVGVGRADLEVILVVAADRQHIRQVDLLDKRSGLVTEAAKGLRRRTSPSTAHLLPKLRCYFA